jgi:hypothetical protein
MQSHPHPAPPRAWVRIPNPGSGTQGPGSGITDQKGTPPSNHRKGTDPDQDINLRSGSGYPSLTTGFNTHPAGSRPIQIRIRAITYRIGTRIPSQAEVKTSILPDSDLHRSGSEKNSIDSVSGSSPQTAGRTIPLRIRTQPNPDPRHKHIGWDPD